MVRFFWLKCIVFGAKHSGILVDYIPATRTRFLKRRAQTILVSGLGSYCLTQNQILNNKFFKP